VYKVTFTNFISQVKFVELCIMLHIIVYSVVHLLMIIQI